MSEILAGGSLVMTEQDCPTRIGEVVSKISEIVDISNPRVGMMVYCREDGINYIIKSLKSKTINGVVVNNAAVDKYEPFDIKAAEAEMTKRIQGVSEESNAMTDPFKSLGKFETFESLLDKLDTLCNIEGMIGSSRNNGYFRALVGGIPVAVNNFAENYSDDVWSQEITCPKVLRNDVIVEDGYYSDGARYEKHSFRQKFVSPANSDGNGLLNVKDWYSSVKRFARKRINGVWGNWYDKSNGYVNSQNYGKTIALFGGSYAQNARGGDIVQNETKYSFSFSYKGTNYSLIDYIAERLGATAFDDYAVGGQGNCTEKDLFLNNTYNQIVESYEKVGPYDIYVLFAGINDYGKAVEVGKATDGANDSTFCGGLIKSIDYIRTNAPHARIYMVTPFKNFKGWDGELTDWGWNPNTTTVNEKGKRLYDYTRAFRDVAFFKSVPVLDVNSMQNISGANYEPYYIYDGIHPNGIGYFTVADTLTEFLAYSRGNSIYIDEMRIAAMIKVEENRAKAAEELLMSLIKGSAPGEGGESVGSVEWGQESNINNFTTAGVFNIRGERLNVDDGLPIANSNPGHTISARLIVLDSSITGTGDGQDKCITQMITLSNRTGEDGNMYIRTGHGASFGSLSWEPWGRLQTNIEVGITETLNNYVDNGIYSGVLSTTGETFVLIVINNYLVAGETDTAHCISQLKYSLEAGGNVEVQKRARIDNEWTGWERLSSGGGIVVEGATMARVTYNELKAMRDNGELVSGTKYRITDYVTTTAQENTVSAGHEFDVIVEALDENTLSEEAKACMHDFPEGTEEDVKNYFNGIPLEAWELRYCIDNDTERFAWANAESGKGVIYYMKDEYGNECPYDFKNIQFVRYKLNAPAAAESDSRWVKQLSININTAFENDHLSFVWHGCDNKNYNWAAKLKSSLTGETKAFYTFSIVENDVASDNSMSGACLGNVVKEYILSGKIKLNNIISFATYRNHDRFHYNSFGGGCFGNSLGGDCFNNTFGDDCRNNTFGDQCYDNCLGDYCGHNNLGGGCFGNSLGGGCFGNSLGGDCEYNNLGGGCEYNNLGGDCYYNTFGNGCYYNCLGNECFNNSFGGDCRYNGFYDDMSYAYDEMLKANLGTGKLVDGVQNVNIGDGCQLLLMYAESADAIKNIQNITVAQGLVPDSKDENSRNIPVIIEITQLKQPHALYVCRASNGDIKVYSEADEIARLDERIDNILVAEGGVVELSATPGDKDVEIKVNGLTTKIPSASSSRAGVMTAEDKKKLDSIKEDITWSTDSNLDTFTNAGNYNISGTKVDGDNLPILNYGTVNARLTVLVADDCVTQVLTLLNVAGGEGNVYIRTKQGDTWKPWGKLQTNVEVGQITPDGMSNLIDNGIYSGVCVDGTTVETFVLIVINNYLAATQAGFGAYVSQLKYAIDLNRGNTVKTRTRDAYGIWNEWSKIGGSSYELPVATVETIGGVKLGTQLSHSTLGDLSMIPISLNNNNQAVFQAEMPFTANGGRLQVQLGTGLQIIEGKLAIEYSLPNPLPTEGLKVVPLSLGTGPNNTEGSWTTHGFGVPVDTEVFALKEAGLTLKDGITPGVTKVTWGETSNMNDFKTPGVYDIYGERTVKTDNLPISNDGSGHSIAARLTVVASTLQPANNEICITQFLQLSNRIGGEGNIYIRTYNENNNGLSGWSEWKKQQGMVETYINTNDTSINSSGVLLGTGVDYGLNGMTDNGMYSGIYTDYLPSPTFFETFVLVVINDYAASGQLNLPRHITQLKYAVDAMTGQCTVKKRVGTGSDSISWGDWEDVDTRELVEKKDVIPVVDDSENPVQSKAIAAAIKEGEKRALRRLFVAAGAEYNNSGTDKTKTAPWGETVIHKAGHYYLNGLGDITEQQMMDIYNAPHDGRTSFAYARNDARTFILRGGTQQMGITSLVAWFGQAYNMEALGLVNFLGVASGSCERMFSGCVNLRHLYLDRVSFLYASNFNDAFTGCSSLITCCIKKVAKNIAFADSSKISKESIIYIVENAAPTSAITITLHPDAYTRLADDTDIVAALNEKNGYTDEEGNKVPGSLPEGASINLVSA